MSRGVTCMVTQRGRLLAHSTTFVNEERPDTARNSFHTSKMHSAGLCMDEHGRASSQIIMCRLLPWH